MKNTDSIKWFYDQAAEALRYVKRYPERRGMLNRHYELEGASIAILHFFGSEDFDKTWKIKRAFYRKAEQIITEENAKYKRMQKEIDAIM